MYIKILTIALIPFIAMILGGILGANFNLNSRFRSLLLHLAAGVIFAVVAIDLLPEIIENKAFTPVSIGFFAGLAVMLTIKYFTRKNEKAHKSKILSNEIDTNKLLPWGLIFGIAVDIILDGVLLGIGFAAGESEGLLLCIALSLEILVLGLVVSTELKSEKYSKKKILLIVSILPVCIIIGAIIGSVILSIAGEVTLTTILAFGLSALVYLVVEELLVEAHQNEDSLFGTAVFFIGFFIFFIIAQL